MTDNIAIVTGAPGWLGSRLVKALLEGLPDDAPPQGVSYSQIRVAKLPGIANGELDDFGDKIKIYDCDISRRADVDGIMEGASGATVFHCAGIIHPSKGRSQFYEVNVEGARNLVEASTAAGVKRFIHVSSNSPIGCNPDRNELFTESSPYNPYMHYGKSKKVAEDIVNAAFTGGQIETVIIRPPWFYGPGQPPRQSLFFQMIKSGKVPIVGDGENLRSMAYVDNICQGLMLCDTVEGANGKTYWIADERPYTMNEIVDTIEKVMEEKFDIKCAHKRMRLPGIASEVAYLVDMVIQEAGLYHQKFHVLSEMNKNIACSIERAKKELGYSPKVALEEGMTRSIQWVLDQGRTI
ncbi:MAG TPA: NAD-dependent epimerase/dehydratase family protein [Candidatus Melainabacteria bacterium]|nr:NAD-dependent epimerase/dehydratase family protein [Candidatus Melainabacteria bacterium]